jgi:acetate kinase
VKILVLNSGSSSIKYRLFDMAGRTVLASGLIEQIGEAIAQMHLTCRTPAGKEMHLKQNAPVPDHREGLQRMIDTLLHSGVIEDLDALDAIGHRVVHGGNAFQEPALIDADIIEVIASLAHLAPLHNPANLAGIKVAMQLCPDLPQVAVFDTAFHQSLPPYAYLYALPYELFENDHVRRYGFHGTSHCYVSKTAAAHLGKPLNTLNLISLHLGNGASATAVEAGKSVDTSMGMSPLEGLVMGSRSGDIDPAVIFYLAREKSMSIDEIDALLNKESGLKGICGHNDLREIISAAEAGDERAELALEIFSYRVKKYIGAYVAALGRVDALIFTGGIGEHAAEIRKRICSGLEEGLGIAVDPNRNSGSQDGPFEIQSEKSRMKVLVVPTDEEFEIALQTEALVKSKR